MNLWVLRSWSWKMKSRGVFVEESRVEAVDVYAAGGDVDDVRFGGIAKASF